MTDPNINELFPGAQGENPVDPGNAGTPDTGGQPDPTNQGTPEPANPVDSNPENNNTIRQMREAIAESNNQRQAVKGQLEAVAKHLGMSVEEFLKQKEEEEIANKAKTNGLSPEIQSKLDQYDNYFKAQEEEKIRTRFNTNIGQLMNDFNLTEDVASDFLRDAGAKGIDVLNSPLTHSQLYFALNRDTIMETEREKIKQEVLADIKSGGSGAPAPGINGTPSTGEKKTLDDLLSELK